MSTIKLTDIPRHLLKALDYSKLHTTMFNKTKHIKSIYILGNSYRLYMFNGDSGGEYRFKIGGSAESIVIDIY